MKCLSERHVNLVVELWDTSENMQEWVSVRWRSTSKKKFKIDNCINPNVGTNHTSRRFFTIRNDLMKDYKLQRVSIFEKEYGFHRSLFTCLLQWHDAQVHFICLWGFISLEWYLNFTSKLILSWNIICSDLEVDYESEENASMVYAALAVDKEVILHAA